MIFFIALSDLRINVPSENSSSLKSKNRPQVRHRHQANLKKPMQSIAMIILDKFQDGKDHVFSPESKMAIPGPSLLIIPLALKHFSFSFYVYGYMKE